MNDSVSFRQADFEEQAAELEKEMFKKEQETLEVLQEIEKTKSLVAELKTRIKTETSEQNDVVEQEIVKIGGCVGIPSSAPGFVLLELKRAKTSLVKTTNDIDCLRTAVESYVLRIEKEKKALEMTRETLNSNVSDVSCLKKELNDANEKLKFAKEVRANDALKNADSLSNELELLNGETKEFKKVGEAAKCEVLKAMSDIESMKNKLNIMEMNLIAAQKIKAAARASESLGIVDLKALNNNVNEPLSNEVTLSAAEYSSLKSKAREAQEKCKVKVEDAMFEVHDAKLSKMEILRKVEEATEEVKATKMALEEALKRSEVANESKIDLDKALRRKKCEHSHRKRCCCARKSAKLKNGSQNGRKKVTSLKDLQINLKSEWSDLATRPTLSIGQILSQKLLHPTEQDENAPENLPNENTAPNNASLREMLSIDKSENVSKSNKVKRNSIDKQHCAKRKTFGLGKISILLSKQSKKNKSIPSFKHCTGKAIPHHDRLSFG